MNLRRLVFGTSYPWVLALTVASAGCSSGGAQPASDEAAGGADEGALKTKKDAGADASSASSGSDAAPSLTPCTQGGTENMNGIEGSYELAGPAPGGEMKTLTLSNLRPVPGRIESEADYHRTLSRQCVVAGCEKEDGTASMLPDNAAFSPVMTFTPNGQPAGSGSIYFLFGLKRENGVVTEICLAGGTAGPTPPTFLPYRRK